MNFGKTLCINIKSRVPFISVETPDERRLIELIREEIKELESRSIYKWSITKGLMKDTEDGLPQSSGFFNKAYPKKSDQPKRKWEAVKGATPPADGCGCNPMDFFKALNEIPVEESAVIIAQDFTPYMSPSYSDGVKVQRRLKDYYEYLKGVKKTIIFTSTQQAIPAEMRDYFAVLEVPLPTREELHTIFDNAYDNYRSEANSDYKRKEVVAKLEKQIKDDPTLIDRMVSAGLGLTADTFETVVSKQIAMHEFSVKMIIEEKKQIIKGQGLLELWDPSVGLEGVGGLENAKEMVRTLKACNTLEAEKRGVKPPKTIMLAGPPGTGKTLLAKVISVEMEEPLLILNMSNLVSKYLGETGHNVIKGLRQADAMAPDILLLDEIEKILPRSESSGGAQTHEELTRTFGSILSHFEESNAAVIKIATTNNPTVLPQELVSRFEIIIWVGIPTYKERLAIFKIQLEQLDGPKRDMTKFDFPAMAKASKGFVGREIRTIIKEANRAAFRAGAPDISTEFILEQIGKVKPLSEQAGRKEEMESMKKRMGEGVIQASEPEEEEKPEEDITNHDEYTRSARPIET